MIAKYEEWHKAQHGRYARADELSGQAADAFAFVTQETGHIVELSASRDKFTAVLKPRRWGLDGFRSLYVDESMVLRSTFVENADPRKGDVFHMKR